MVAAQWRRALMAGIEALKDRMYAANKRVRELSKFPPGVKETEFQESIIKAAEAKRRVETAMMEARADHCFACGQPILSRAD